MEPTLGALREWLLTPAPTVAGLETPYLLAREVPPPLAFVLHLCHTWSPELILVLAGIGALACAIILGWTGVALLRATDSLLVMLCRGLVNLHTATASQPHLERPGTTPPAPAPRESRIAVPERRVPVETQVVVPESRVVVPPTSTVVLAADREARLRTLHASDSEGGATTSLSGLIPTIPAYPSERVVDQPRETRRRRQTRDPCLR